MPDPKPGLHFTPWYLLLAALATAWGIAAFLHTSDLARAGYSLSRGHQVVRIVPDSPAELAGLRAGDSIISINGVATRDRAAVARMSRGDIGAVRSLVIQRGEESLPIQVTLAGLTVRERGRRHAGIFTGFCFLVFCGVAFLQRPGRATRALAVMGLGIGLAFMGTPVLSPESTRLAGALARNALILAGIGAGLHFLRLMVVPVTARRMHAAVIYVPLGLLWMLLSVRTLYGEETPNLVRSFTSVTGGLLLGVYLTLAIITLTKAWVRSRQKQTNSEELLLLCLGTLLGILPVAAAALLPVVAPSAHLPGLDYWFLSLVLVPLSWARATVTTED